MNLHKNILTSTIKGIIKTVFRILEKLKLKIAEDKTMIGRTSTKCFDFLGFNISADGLSVSKKSIRKFAENIVMKLNLQEKLSSENFSNRSSRAYGSGCLGITNKKGELSIPESISRYTQRWLTWIKSIYGKEKIKVLSPVSPLWDC